MRNCGLLEKIIHCTPSSVIHNVADDRLLIITPTVLDATHAKA